MQDTKRASKEGRGEKKKEKKGKKIWYAATRNLTMKFCTYKYRAGVW